MPDEPDLASSLRILLWSITGAGDHYSGPGSSAFRLYRLADPSLVQVSLAHGEPAQGQYPLFRSTHFIGPFRRDNLGQWRFLRQANAWVRAHAREFDIFHGLEGFQVTVEPAWQAQRMGVPAVVKLATHRIDLAGVSGGLRRLLRLAERRRRRVAELGAVVCISRAIMDECRGYGIPESKLVYLPDGADVDHFRPPAHAQERLQLREHLGWPDRFTVIFAGAIIRRKRPHLLIEACGLLRQRGLDLQLALVGPEHEPQYSADMRLRAHELGIADRLLWSGFSADIAPHYRAADLFCLPSTAEGLPNSMLEAMASGLPPLGTPISGHTDLVDETHRGRFIEPTGESIAAAVAMFATNAALTARHARQCRQFIEQNFSSRATLAGHLALFRRLLAGQSAAG